MENVLVADSDLLAQKIQKICDAGVDQLNVVADWDRTLTRAQTEDGKDTTSYLAIVHGGYLGDDYRDGMDRLYRLYRPVEVSQTMSHHQRQEAMHDWWASAFDLMVQFGLTEEMIADIGRRDLMRLREGAEDLLQWVETHAIAMQILSAGIGNVIASFLNARGLFGSHLEVTANMLEFDPAYKVVGFREPVIHSLNKRANTLGRCVLLLGDTIEDAKMVEDTDENCVLRVGFLNDDVEKNSEIYLNFYDVVICHDGEMHFAVDLLKEMSGK